MLMYGKEASNRKQEIDRQHHTIPRQRNQRLLRNHTHSPSFHKNGIDNDIKSAYIVLTEQVRMLQAIHIERSE